MRSLRQAIKVSDTNVAYRCFLGLSFQTVVPYFSTLGK
ncbi:hypothetical protein [Sporosarcina sp. OR05]